VVGGAGIFIKPGHSFEAEMGYCLKQDVWGLGYGSETAQLLTQFGFRDLKLHRIVATCDPQNTASARVLEKAGLLREGLMREHMRIRSGWRDSLLYAILANDRPVDHNRQSVQHKRCIFAAAELQPVERVELLRARFDPLSGKVPAHVTLVFPFDLPVDNSTVVDHLEASLADQAAFDITFDTCRIGASGYAFLPVLEGALSIRQIYDKLNTGVLQVARNQQRFTGEFRPHLTIGRVETPDALWAAARDMAGVNRGLKGRIRRIVLETILLDDGSRIEHTTSLR
jgi:2'-5' RNA ligase